MNLVNFVSLSITIISGRLASIKWSVGILISHNILYLALLVADAHTTLALLRSHFNHTLPKDFVIQPSHIDACTLFEPTYCIH